MNPPDDLYVEDPESYIKNADSNLINFAVYRMRSQIAGIKISDLGTRPELQRRLAQIAMSMHERFTSLHDIIFALWSTPVGPHSLAAYRDWETDRKSTRLNSSHRSLSRMPSSA